MVSDDEKTRLHAEAVAILSELIKKEHSSRFLGDVNFQPERDAKKIADFIKAYIKQFSE